MLSGRSKAWAKRLARSIAVRPDESRLTGTPTHRKEPFMLVYKIFRTPEMEAFTKVGRTAGAPVDLADGYVHLSTAKQVAETLSRHFAGETGLWLLALEADTLSDLKWEPSRGGDLFPHLYRDLMAADVLWSREIPLGPQGHEIGELE